MRRREFLAGVLATTTPSVLWAADPNKVYRLAVCSQFGMDSLEHGENLLIGHVVSGVEEA